MRRKIFLKIDPTCFKNSKNPSCIDLLLTNFKSSFKKTSIFLKLVSLTIIKWSLLSWNYILLGKVLKQNTAEITVNMISITWVLNSLSRQLDSVFCSIKENVDYEELNEFSRFHRVFLNLLNIQAPLKKKTLRSNNSPFMTKTLRKIIMIRSIYLFIYFLFI